MDGTLDVLFCLIKAAHKPIQQFNASIRPMAQLAEIIVVHGLELLQQLQGRLQMAVPDEGEGEVLKGVGRGKSPGGVNAVGVLPHGAGAAPD